MKFSFASFDVKTPTGEFTTANGIKMAKLDADLNGITIAPCEHTKVESQFSGKINRKELNLNWNVFTLARSIELSDKVKIVVGT